MDIIYNKYRSNTEKYDNMMVKAGTLFMELQFLLTDFVKEILIKIDTELDMELQFPVFIGDIYKIVRSEKIFLDDITGNIMISLEDHEDNYNWSDLSVTIQDMIANKIHIDIKTCDVYGEIFMN